jgi:hypothetical protein
MPRWQTLAWGGVGFALGYYFVKHWHVSGGRIV